ncbi:MAG: hypothetical protein HYY29_03520 [Chloroflexi bacterium]|nr:hypothetical protein [Chloroflexota bacterium]
MAEVLFFSEHSLVTHKCDRVHTLGYVHIDWLTAAAGRYVISMDAPPAAIAIDASGTYWLLAHLSNVSSLYQGEVIWRRDKVEEASQ